MDVLVDSKATVVNTSSASQKLLRNVTIADLESTERRRPAVAYALVKLANILFTRELHRRYHADGLSVAVVHPGNVDTNFGDASGSRFLTFMRRTPVRRLTITADQGAEQLVRLASTTPGVDWTPGEYYAKHKVTKANGAAYDPALARELWDRTMSKLA
jgi:NAD(P)-dependent dehydrogenase (short-subunit alcohol dehydrogenase family)